MSWETGRRPGSPDESGRAVDLQTVDRWVGVTVLKRKPVVEVRHFWMRDGIRMSD